jgi:4-carboxymuconolactone decarboxylase
MDSDDRAHKVGRLRAVTEHELDDAQRRLWDLVVDGPRGSAAWMVANGVLAGPFNAWLQVPEIGKALAEAGERLRFSSQLDPIMRELVILTVGAHWRSEFEFWAHSGIATAEGMSTDLIEAIATVDSAAVNQYGGATNGAVYELVRALLEQGHPSEEQIMRVCELIGESAAVEAVTLAGYYTTVSFTLNAFDVPLPAGVAHRWSLS